MATTRWWTHLKSINLLGDNDPPPLYPPGASADYQAARQELAAAEAALRDQMEAVATQRRALPPGPIVTDYRFTEGPPDLDAADDTPTQVSLGELFGPHDELIVYHLMFHPDDDAGCAACSMLIDGLHGVSHHIQRRTGLAVIGKAPIGKLREWARVRGWHGLRMVSGFDTSFTTDLGTEGAAGGQWSSVSVFTRGVDGIRHSYLGCTDFPNGTGRGLDPITLVWNVFDLLPSGRGPDEPESLRPGRLRGAAAATLTEGQ